ncbi:MAG TPA: thiamine phosphate synthase [Gemmatimonadales bacterium]|nr:thiamine phosphate synthase [Gemmatimonadales bacterium]
MKSPAALPRLHAITDERVARRPDVGEIARQLAGTAGADLALHARGRTLSGLEHFELANRLSVYPPSRLFVNDRLDVALAIGAAGVQLGQSSLAIEDARRLEAGWWIGKSVHDLAEAEAARAAGADYLVVGPVFITPTHPGREPLGTARLGLIARLGIKTIAIGGVTAERVPAVRDTGAYGVAAIRALWDVADPAGAARRMLEELNG